MAQNHNADYSEKPMTTYGRTQGPSRRYRRLRHPMFPAAEWTAKNPLLQRGEIGIESDTHKAKVGDGTTYWNSLPYAMVAETEWGNIVGDINDQTDLKNALDDKVDKTTTASQVYGTDQNGDQTTYNTTDFSLVDDVKVNNVSVVTNKVADIDLTSYLQNTATATDAITVNGVANTSWVDGINIGKDSRINSNNGIAIGVEASADVNAVAYGRDADAGVRGTAIGAYAKTSYDTGIAIGCWNSVMHNAVSSAKGAYQFGVGTNNTARTLNVGWYNDSVTPSTFVNYQLLDGDTGLIPDARISTNIARTADIPTVNDATLTIQKNGTTVDTFTANAASNVTMNITVPTTPADIGAQSEITASNKLNADLVDDSTSTNKFVTASDITTWNGKQDTLTAGTNINITGTTISATDTTYTGSDGVTLTGTNFTNSGVRAVASGTANGTISVNTNGTSADVAVTGLGSAAYTSSSDYATAAQGGKADTAVQPGDDVSDLNNDVGYQTAGDVATAISGKQDTLTAGTNITITGTTISATDTTYSDFTGATAGDAGTKGLVPAPAAGDQAKFLQGDGTWANPTAATAWGNITGTLADQTDLQNALAGKADDNAVVHLADTETITGLKTFTQTVKVKPASANYITGFETIHVGFANNYTTPTTPKGFQIGCLANDNSYMGWFGVAKGTDGTTSSSITARRRGSSSDSNHDATLSVGIDSSNNSWASAPASDVNGSIVTTVNKSKGQSGYFKLGNGLLVQWGRATCTVNTQKTVNLPTSFSGNISYGVTTAGISSSYGNQSHVVSQSSSSFVLIPGNSNVLWIAIGY